MLLNKIVIKKEVYVTEAQWNKTCMSIFCVKLYALYLFSNLHVCSAYKWETLNSTYKKNPTFYGTCYEYINAPYLSNNGNGDDLNCLPIRHNIGFCLTNGISNIHFKKFSSIDWIFSCKSPVFSLNGTMLTITDLKSYFIFWYAFLC